MTLTFNPPVFLCISNFSIPRIWRTHETRRHSRSRQRGNVSSIADRKGKRSDRDLLAAATRFRFARSHILRYFHGGLSRFLLLSLSSTSHSIQQPSRKGSIHAYIGDLTWLTNTRPWITCPALISAPRTRMTNDPTCCTCRYLERERFVAWVSSESAAETSRDVIKLSLSMSRHRAPLSYREEDETVKFDARVSIFFRISCIFGLNGSSDTYRW